MKIPTFTCKPGCNACCGPVPVSPADQKAIEALRGEVAWGKPPVGLPEGYALTPFVNGTCGFSTPLGCAVYAVRPIMCRLFGAVDAPLLECPKGCKPVNLLTQAEADQLMQEDFIVNGSRLCR